MPYFESGGGIKSTTEQVTTAASGNAIITAVRVNQKLLNAYVVGEPYPTLPYITGAGDYYGVHIQNTVGAAIGSTTLNLKLFYTD